MAHHITQGRRPAWRILLEVSSWIVLLAGLVFTAQIALGIIQSARVTTDSLCSAAGAFVVLLIGSLVNSVARE